MIEFGHTCAKSDENFVTNVRERVLSVVRQTSVAYCFKFLVSQFGKEMDGSDDGGSFLDLYVQQDVSLTDFSKKAHVSRD
jgi:hypothetical protein